MEQWLANDPHGILESLDSKNSAMLEHIIERVFKDAATERVRAMAMFAEEMVHWLQCFEVAMITHRSTEEYGEARQRSGTTKNISGLTQEQISTKNAHADARWYLMTFKKIASDGRCRREMNPWEFWLYDLYWSGALEEEYTGAKVRTKRVLPFRS